MGFEKSIYNDGEIHYSFPKWKKDLLKMTSVKNKNLYQEIEKDNKINPMEVGLKNNLSESQIKIKDDGSIDLFASENSGISIKQDGTVVVFANRIQFLGTQIEMLSSLLGTSFNQETLFSEGLSNPNEKKGKTEKLKQMMKENQLI